mmetsp:Transcript_54822/g.74945  ORF Transcript_54822/g.74945 Transcript_54822/m.74945 type:complete len:447 (-) Transcript_54822:1796-3136(-)
MAPKSTNVETNVLRNIRKGQPYRVIRKIFHVDPKRIAKKFPNKRSFNESLHKRYKAKEAGTKIVKHLVDLPKYPNVLEPVRKKIKTSGTEAKKAGQKKCPFNRVAWLPCTLENFKSYKRLFRQYFSIRIYVAWLQCGGTLRDKALTILKRKNYSKSAFLHLFLKRTTGKARSHGGYLWLENNLRMFDGVTRALWGVLEPITDRYAIIAIVMLVRGIYVVNPYASNFLKAISEKGINIISDESLLATWISKGNVSKKDNGYAPFGYMSPSNFQARCLIVLKNVIKFYRVRPQFTFTPREFQELLSFSVIEDDPQFLIQQCIGDLWYMAIEPDRKILRALLPVYDIRGTGCYCPTVPHLHDLTRETSRNGTIRRLFNEMGFNLGKYWTLTIEHGDCAFRKLLKKLSDINDPLLKPFSITTEQLEKRYPVDEKKSSEYQNQIRIVIARS